MLREYSRVMLVNDKHVEEGGRQGMIGYVIEVYEDGKYEIEFSDAATGVTLAQFVVGEDDIVETPESLSGGHSGG